VNSSSSMERMSVGTSSAVLLSLLANSAPIARMKSDQSASSTSYESEIACLPPPVLSADWLSLAPAPACSARSEAGTMIRRVGRQL
jgi:hypothetical protein